MSENDAGFGLVEAMGLLFRGPLGVAAGVDRTGGKIATLDLGGFGHFEIGTVTPESAISIGDRPRSLRIGVNFGSSRPGFDEAVFVDYCTALRRAYPHADYLCANLSAPQGGRDGDAPSAADLMARLKAERDRLAAATGVWRPLLLKLAAGETSRPLPTALAAARRLGLDGIVLVGSDLRRIAAAKDFIGDLTLISVGGVMTANDAVARVRSGASLVQTCSAFAADGALALRTLGLRFAHSGGVADSASADCDRRQ